MVISWVYSVAMTIQHIVAEKEHRLKEVGDMEEGRRGKGWSGGGGRWRQVRGGEAYRWGAAVGSPVPCCPTGDEDHGPLFWHFCY